MAEVTGDAYSWGEEEVYDSRGICTLHRFRLDSRLYHQSSDAEARQQWLPRASSFSFS